MNRIIACVACLGLPGITFAVDVESVLEKIDMEAVRKSVERERNLLNEVASIFGLSEDYGSSVPRYKLSEKLDEVYEGRPISHVDLCSFLNVQNSDSILVDKSDGAVSLLFTNVYSYGDAGMGKVMIQFLIQLDESDNIKHISVYKSMDGV